MRVAARVVVALLGGVVWAALPVATSFIVLPSLRPGRYAFVDEFHTDTGRMWVVAR